MSRTRYTALDKEALKTSVARQLKPVSAAVDEVAAYMEAAEEREASFACSRSTTPENSLAVCACWVEPGIIPESRCTTGSTSYCCPVREGQGSRTSVRGALPETPLVSAVIAVRNGEEFVAESVESVLSQTWSRIECVVVDDGSDDATTSVVSAFEDDRVRLVRQPHSGVSTARNRGIKEGRGDLIAFLDADDVWRPAKIARQVEAFREHPGAGMVVTGYQIVDTGLQARSTVLPNASRLDLRKVLMLERSGLALSSTGMFRREVLEDIGGLDEALSVSADLDLLWRVGQRYNVVGIAEALALYRLHDKQMHLDLASLERDLVHLYEHALGSGTAGSPSKRRAMGNLYTRLLIYECKRKGWKGACRALGLAVANRPDRLVALPVIALGSRGARTLRSRRNRS